jgi:hypothetical protein
VVQQRVRALKDSTSELPLFTGDFRLYVSDPFNRWLTGSIRLGGIVSRTAYPASGPLNGGLRWWK